MNTFHFSASDRAAQALSLLGFAVLCVLPGAAAADPISPENQATISAYIKQMEGWAGHPTIIAAVKESNAKGGIPGMNNGKWDGLEDADPLVKSIQSSPAGKLLTDWDKNPGISKLYVRDEKANLLAGSNKALRYNNASAPQFSSCAKGGAWFAREIKPDPTTGVKSVQVCVPVLDGGKAIGVMNSAVTIEK